MALKEPQFFQVRTNLEFSGPAPAFGSAVLEAGGRTGAAVATFVGTPASSKIRYTKTVNQFGGPSQTRVVAATPVHAWAHVLSVMAPCQHPVFGGDAMDPNDAGCVAVLFAEYPDPLVAAGAAVGFTAMTPGGPQPSPNVFFASVPNATGLLAMSAPVPGPPPTNRATSAGFPWTTGMVTVSQPGALGGAEKFVITGNDTRGIPAITPAKGRSRWSPAR